jgi:alcohol dehydrogenase class IV
MTKNDPVPPFELITPGRIVFARGAVDRLGRMVAAFGRRPLVVIGGASLAASGALSRVMDGLAVAGCEPVACGGLRGEPDPATVDRVATAARVHAADAVIAIGGGSVIDAAKAAAALAVNPGGVEAYLEGVGDGRALVADPLPFIAVPTTAGSGAECTKNAVICDHAKKYKKSFRDPRLLARLVLVDPLLTVGLPAAETAYGGMDAIAQLLEAAVTKKRNPLATALALPRLAEALDALPIACREPDALAARETMALASLSSGLALANAGLGAVHGFAAGIGGMYPIAHGLVCAMLLAPVTRFNIERAPDAYAAVLAMFGETPTGFVERLAGLAASVGIPERLREIGIPADALPEIVQRSRGSSMDGNPVAVDDAVWAAFLETVY